MNAEIDTYSRYICEKITQLQTAAKGLSEDDLNRSPGLPGANSPYVIVTHTLGNIRAWVLGITCGVDMSRDRPAEFSTRGTYEQLEAAAGKLSADIHTALKHLGPQTLSDRFVPAQELWGEGTPTEYERRACLAHVLEHAGIHLGHLHMTLDLLRR